MRLRSTVLLVSLSLFGCEFEGLSGRDTKVARGELYQSGDGRYDGYFAQVHHEQKQAAQWPDESKAARKPIIMALDLRPGASNTIILAAARDKKGDANVGKAIDETTAAERELEAKLTAAGDRLEDLTKKGEELKRQAIEDRRNINTSADKVDEAKVKKKEDVKREMTAAVDTAESLTNDAKRGAKEAHELARKLKSTWSGKDEPDEPAPAAKKPAAATPAAPAAKPAAGKPAATPAAKPAADPKPEPKKPEEKPGEVFNP